MSLAEVVEHVARLVHPDTYRAERAHLFPSAESFAWFVRKNRTELAQAGALSKPNGRWLVQPEAFDHAVIVIGARRAEGRNA